MAGKIEALFLEKREHFTVNKRYIIVKAEHLSIDSFAS
jgi:hypothetical protein